MIKKLVKAKEVSVAIENQVGVLARMMSFLANHGINVETIAGHSDPSSDHGNLIFITDNNQKTIAELIDNGYEDIEENDVIVIELEDRPGALKNISEILANYKINIDYLYCTTCSSGCPAKIVLATSDNDRAFDVLSAA